MDRKFVYRYIITLLMLLCVLPGKAQLTLTLERTITLAADSSLDAFRYKNMYLAGYWEYRTYKAGRLPSLTLKSDTGTIPPLFYSTIRLGSRYRRISKTTIVLCGRAIGDRTKFRPFRRYVLFGYGFGLYALFR